MMKSYTLPLTNAKNLTWVTTKNITITTTRAAWLFCICFPPLDSQLQLILENKSLSGSKIHGSVHCTLTRMPWWRQTFHAELPNELLNMVFLKIQTGCLYKTTKKQQNKNVFYLRKGTFIIIFHRSIGKILMDGLFSKKIHLLSIMEFHEYILKLQFQQKTKQNKTTKQNKNYLTMI